MSLIKNKIFPYLIFFILFFLAPILTNYMEDYRSKDIMILSIVIINPLFVIGAGILFTIKNGFKWYFTVFIPLMFLPACYIVYNNSALGYILFYAALSGIGQGIGLLIRRIQ